MDAASNKRVRVGVTGATGPVSSVRKRQAFADVNSSQDAAAGADAASLEGLENATVEFTVEALLNYKQKIKKFDLLDMYVKFQEYNTSFRQYNNKVLTDLPDSNDSKRAENEKLSIVENLGALRSHYTALQEQPTSCKTIGETHLTEHQVLRSSLDSAKKKCIETEIQMAKRLEELDVVIAGLRNNNLSLQEQLAKESSEKQVIDPEVINFHLREKEGRIAAEKLQVTLLEVLEKCKQEILVADRQIATHNDMCQILQEYNTSLQQYNNKLLTDLSDSNDSLKRVENEKLSIVENFGALRSHYTALQE